MANDKLEKPLSGKELNAQVKAAIARAEPNALVELDELEQAMTLSRCLQDLQGILTEPVVKQMLVPLQGSKLGFRTDKDKDGGYDWEIVRDCAIEAMMRGFRVVGNEFNIIAGGFYGTQEGFERKVRSFPGLTDLVMLPQVPRLDESKAGALVPYRAQWKLNGVPQAMSCELIDGIDQRIAVRVNAGQGADAILGKAKRKMLAKIWERLTGMRAPDDGDVLDVPGHEVKDEPGNAAQKLADELVDRHKKERAKPPSDGREPGQEG